jgi:hypothetical protein
VVGTMVPDQHETYHHDKVGPCRLMSFWDRLRRGASITTSLEAQGRTTTRRSTMERSGVASNSSEEDEGVRRMQFAPLLSRNGPY